jgi:hypothetical protein
LNSGTNVFSLKNALAKNGDIGSNYFMYAEKDYRNNGFQEIYRNLHPNAENNEHKTLLPPGHYSWIKIVPKTLCSLWRFKKLTKRPYRVVKAQEGGSRVQVPECDEAVGERRGDDAVTRSTEPDHLESISSIKFWT